MSRSYTLQANVPLGDMCNKDSYLSHVRILPCISSACSHTSPFSDSENTAVTLSALLASLNSCCNPWIYMLFGGHLLYDFLRCFPCCRKLGYGIRNDSDSSLRRNTLLSKLPAACTPPNASDSWKDSQKNSQSVAQDCPDKVNRVDSSHKNNQTVDNLNKHSHTNQAQVLDTDS